MEAPGADAPAQRVTVAGVGRWGERVVQILLDERADVALVSRPGSPRRAHLEELFPGCPIFADADAALGAGYDGRLFVCTPTPRHADDAVHALELGVDTFVEKPLATTKVDAELVRETARSRGRRTLVGHVFLFSDLFEEIVRLGAADPPRQMRAAWHRPVLRHLDVGWELLPHPISIALTLFERHVDSVHRSGPFGPDRALIDLTFGSGRRAKIVAVRSPTRRTLVEVETASGRVLRWDDRGLWAVEDGRPAVVLEAQREPLRHEIRSFLAPPSDTGEAVSDAAFGVDVVEVIEQAAR